MTRLCREGDGEPTVDPRSSLCYWHRAARMSPADQQVLARARREGPPSPSVHYARAGFRSCVECCWPIPLWYMTGPRCRPCAALKRQAGHRERTYGLGVTDHDALMALQDGRCAVCRKRQTMQALAVDHDHQSGKVRGLLCKGCNKGILGSGFDSARLLFAAAAYLMCPPASGSWVPPERLDAAMAAFRTAYVETAAGVTK